MFPSTKTSSKIEIKKIAKPNDQQKTHAVAAAAPATPPREPKFFVKFNDNISPNEAAKSGFKIIEKNYLSNMFTELKAQNDGDLIRNNKTTKSLLNWTLEDTSVSANPSGCLNYSYLDYMLKPECSFEENEAYYKSMANNVHPSNIRKSINPILDSLLDMTSKLNEHHLNSKKSELYEKQLKMVSFIYSMLKNNMSLSDSLILCPRKKQEIAFNIYKQIDLINAKNSDPTTSTKPPKTTTLNKEANVHVKQNQIDLNNNNLKEDQTNAQFSLPPNKTDALPSSSSLFDLFDGNFDNNLINNDLINLFCGDINKDFLTNEADNLKGNYLNQLDEFDMKHALPEEQSVEENIAPPPQPAEFMADANEFSEPISSPLIHSNVEKFDVKRIQEKRENFIRSNETKSLNVTKDLRFKVYLNKFITLVINTLYKLCVYNESHVNYLLERYRTNKLNYEIRESVFKSEVEKLRMKKIKINKDKSFLISSELQETTQKVDKTLSTSDLESSKLFKDLTYVLHNNCNNQQLEKNSTEFFREIMDYHQLIKFNLDMFCQRANELSIEDSYHDFIEFKLFLHDLLYDLVLKENKNKKFTIDETSKKNLHSILSPGTVMMEKAVNERIVDPRNHKNNPIDVDLTIVKFNMNLNFLDNPTTTNEESPFNEKLYIQNKYKTKIDLMPINMNESFYSPYLLNKSVDVIEDLNELELFKQSVAPCDSKNIPMYKKNKQQLNGSRASCSPFSIPKTPVYNPSTPVQSTVSLSIKSSDSMNRLSQILNDSMQQNHTIMSDTVPPTPQLNLMDSYIDDLLESCLEQENKITSPIKSDSSTKERKNSCDYQNGSLIAEIQDNMKKSRDKKRVNKKKESPDLIGKRSRSLTRTESSSNEEKWTPISNHASSRIEIVKTKKKSRRDDFDKGHFKFRSDLVQQRSDSLSSTSSSSRETTLGRRGFQFGQGNNESHNKRYVNTRHQTGQLSANFADTHYFSNTYLNRISNFHQGDEAATFHSNQMHCPADQQQQNYFEYNRFPESYSNNFTSRRFQIDSNYDINSEFI